jgi:rhodanese-related sulfurtransferase
MADAGAATPVPEVAVDAARARAAAGAVVLDVREPDEWHAGHVQGALWIPMGQVAARQAEIPDERALVVICRSGARSGKVVAALVQAGYDAANVTGGMKAWAAAGYAVVVDDGGPGVVA